MPVRGTAAARAEISPSLPRGGPPDGHQPQAEPRHTGRVGLGLAALGVLAFSLTFPATSLALRGFDPYVVGAGRSVVAAAIGGACLRVARAPFPGRGTWAGLVAVAGGCGIGFGLLSALALHRTTSSHAAIVVGLLPAATAVAAVIRSGERPGWVFWTASAAASATIVGYSISLGGGRLSPADLLLLAALAVGAIGYAEGGRLSREMPGWQVIAWGVILALPVSLPITVAAAIGHAPPDPSAAAIVGMAYVSGVSMFAGFAAWYRGLALAGVARASQLQLAQPLLTVGWSALLLDEHVGSGALTVAAIVIVCVLVTQRARIGAVGVSSPDARPATDRGWSPAQGPGDEDEAEEHEDGRRVDVGRITPPERPAEALAEDPIDEREAEADGERREAQRSREDAEPDGQRDGGEAERE